MVIDDHPVTGKDYLHFGVTAHNKIYFQILLNIYYSARKMETKMKRTLEKRIANLEKLFNAKRVNTTCFEADDFNQDDPTDALQDLIIIARAYDQLNDKFSKWFDKHYKVSNELYDSAEDVLKNEYGEVPLMFRHTRSVDEELSNESSLRENAGRILDKFSDTLF